MAIRVKFDNTNNVIWPTFVLATRNGTKLGVVNTTNESLTDNFNSKFELRFDAHKVDNDNENHIWDKLQNFKLLWCKEWDVWFEIYVEIEESDELVKSVECVSLGEAELSQILLHDIEINTEDDIARDNYVPTTLYNDSDPKASLLDRIMEKAPHYSVHHVDTSIASIQRTFSFDNTSIYDAFQDIAEEIGCIFIIDSGTDDNGNIKRQINVYDLESYCYDCGHRGDFRDVCPDCDSTNVQNGYGEDTTVFVSVENLAESITYTTDTDSVKNCFKLEAGDDLMTATVINCNPNGSRYLWYISDEVKEDMSDELVAKLNEYDQEYEFFQNEYSMTIPSDLATQYNNIITKYSSYDSTLTNITNPIVGYSNLMNTYYDTIELYLLLHDTLMPSVETSSTTAESEAAKLTAAALSPVAVQNINSISVATASSAVLSMAKVLVNSNYQVKVGASSLNNKVWTGDFTITNYSDSEDTATSATVSITINGDYETFIRQKIEKSLNTSSNELAVDATSLFKLNLADFTVAIKQFCLVSLNAFSDACQSCMELLIEQGVANDETWANKNPNMYEEVYLPYYDKMSSLQNEIKLRENEINVITGTTDINGGVLTDGIQTILEKHRANVHSALDFEAFLGTDLWLEFTAYRREDVYENSNYISDGLNNAELFKRANEFIEAASKEVYKSATLQHSISASLKDLLVMEEFAPITDKFAVGNWIRVKVNDEVFRLRLISYTLDFAKLEDLSIEFSDVKKYHDGVTDGESVLAQAASMASSYDAVTRQADKGSRANRQLTGWVNDGLALTKMKIVDSADNQNLTWDDHGLLCREYLPITDDYSDKQLKIINRGLYVTDDGWRTSKAGIGDFTYYNPETGLYEEAYGVIADTIVGNIILGDNIGIYNESGSFKVNENGLTLTSSATADNEHLLTIQKENGDGSYTKYVYIDQDGNVVLNAQSVRISSTQTVTSYVEETAESIASSTASNTLQTWVNGDFADTIHELQDGIVDAKIETYYQATDPSTAWTTADLKNSHAGDIWYNSSSSVQKYYRWNGTAWEEMRAMPPQAVMDTVDGKATIYTGTTTPTGMSEGDLWFQGTNQPILTYVNDEWVEYNKYSAAIQGVQNYINSIGEQVDGMAEIHYGTVTPTLNNSPASSWSDTATKDLHVDDLYYNTTDGYCYRFKKSGNTYSWERIKDSDITAAASAASDANDLADQKRRVFVSTPTPPYDRGDLWVEGENGDIWRCATPKTTGQSYAKSDWVKASKYTDDSAATNAYNYASDVMEYAQGLGGLIDDMVEIHYGTAVPTLSNSPASSWSDTTTKNAHLDDLYYDTTTGYCYRFTKSGSTYSWSRLKDKDITDAASLAGQKRRVFVGTSTPTPPYDVGDLWAQGPTGEILKCKKARTSGSYVESDWEKASKYTDDSALNDWIQNDFATAIETLEEGIVDAKVDTWYQASDPSTSWNTDALKNQHAGDIWYNSSPTVQKYYRWSGTAWEEMRATPPKAVMDTVDGKATIFTGTNPAPTGMQEGDLWFKGANEPILTYVGGQWVEYNKYSTAINGVKTYAETLRTQIDGMAEIHYGTITPALNTAPANLWSDTATKDLHVDDLYYNTTNGFCYRFTKNGSTYSWERIKDSDITAAASAASDANDLADQKRRVFVSQPTPPYDIGDLWVEGSTGDIWRCANSKSLGQSYAKSDWVKASKYTDDSAATAAMTYAEDVMDYAEGLGGLIDEMVEIHYGTAAPTLSNAPANTWSDTATKDSHLDDLYYDTATGYCYRFTKSGSTYSWTRLKDKDITAASNLAGQKRRVFVGTSNPTPPYDVGDLWAQGSTGDIMRCKTARASGSYNASDWEKASKYTDDSNLNAFINGDFATTVQSLQNGITDAKVETWYQTSDPSTSWNTATLKTQHTGDIWYNSTSSVQKYYRWSGSAWQEMTASPPDAVMNSIGGKATIFTGTDPTPSGMHEGDLWFKGQGEPILTYVNNQWVEYNKYTAAINGVKDYAEALGGQIDGMAEIHYGTVAPTLSNSPASSWSDTSTKDLHVDDLYYDTASGYCYRFTKSGSTYSWVRIKDSDITAAASTASAANTLAGQKRRVFVSTPYTPYDIGDLWVQGSTGDIMKCKKARASGSYTASDWEKASKYTDDSTLTTWISGDFAATVESLQNGITDAKIETWYQDSDPSTAWTTTTLKNQHTGDIWYNSSSSVQKYYRWNGTAWEEMRATPPKAVMDEVDGKATIFTGTDTPSNPNENDLWFKGQDEPILTYINGQWVEYNKYTDDSAVNNLQIGGRNLLYDTNAPSLVPTGFGGGIRYISNAASLSVNGTGTEWTAIPDPPEPGIQYGMKHVCTTTGGQNHFASFYQGADRVSFVPGMEYTASFWAKSSVAGATVGIGLTANTEWSRTSAYAYTFEEADVWKRISVTFTYLGTSTLTDYNQQNTILYMGYQYDAVGTVWCCGYQVEAGNIATSWSEYSYTQTNYGGKNLIRNTNSIDLSSNATLPNINGYYNDGSHYGNIEGGGGSLSAVEHGVKLIANGNQSISIRFGTATTTASLITRANGLYGLEAGETYTLSFDTKCKIGSLYSGTGLFYLGIYLYGDIKGDGTAGSANTWNIEWFSYPVQYYPGEIGMEKEAHVVFTFTIPKDAVRMMLSIRPGNNAASYVASGDYIEMRNIKLEKGNRATDWSPAPEDVDKSIQDYVTDLQEQIDGKAETWYQEDDPSTTWTTDDLKKQHSGDLWYRASDGATFYYMVTLNESTGVVVSAEWVERTVPTEVFNAINGKAQIFTSVPSNYNKGDLWIDSESGDILVSINANEEFVEEDWVKASKYTDDSNIGDGKNLIINTNIIDITDIENLPRIYDQPIATRTSGGISGITEAEHGFRVTTSSASRPAIRFGSDAADKATMNGLTAGETYTLSFDSKWKMCSAQSNDKQMYVWLQDDRATTGSLAYTPIHSFGTATPNVDGEGRCECTFTIPENVTMCNIYISANSSTAAHYASGDYLELSNIKLEKGGRATAWTPAVEDILRQFEKVGSDIETANSNFTELKTDIDTWMDFNGEALVIGKKFEGATEADDVEFATVIDSSSLSFTQNGETVAYINSNKLFIKEAEIVNSLAVGHFVWSPHKADDGGAGDGGMSLVWNE